jgi:hypothetical protein
VPSLQEVHRSVPVPLQRVHSVYLDPPHLVQGLVPGTHPVPSHFVQFRTDAAYAVSAMPPRMRKSIGTNNRFRRICIGVFMCNLVNELHYKGQHFLAGASPADESQVNLSMLGGIKG